MPDSDHVATFWRYISRSIDRLVDLAVGLESHELTWSPAEGTSSLATLVGHTMANAEDNLVGTLCGRPVTYDRAADFERPDADGAAIAARWAKLRPTIKAALEDLDGDQLTRAMTHPRRGDLTGLDLLIVVARHTAEHLAQAELTLDLLRADR